MSLPSIQLNGIDSAGERLPDELIYEPGEGEQIALCRGQCAWEIRQFDTNGTDVERFEDFATAFAAYCTRVKRRAEVVTA